MEVHCSVHKVPYDTITEDSSSNLGISKAVAPPHAVQASVIERPMQCNIFSVQTPCFRSIQLDRLYGHHIHPTLRRQTNVSSALRVSQVSGNSLYVSYVGWLLVNHAVPWVNYATHLRIELSIGLVFKKLSSLFMNAWKRAHYTVQSF